ncbi:hypothetical protein As57867_015537, partial [Aphanomyces stellatus]
MTLLLGLSVAADASTSGSQCTFVEENIDYVGGDIATSLQVSADSCCDGCVNTPGCVLYSWDNAFGGTCYLKNSAATRIEAFGSRAAKRIVPAATCAPTEDNTDYPGNDMAAPVPFQSVDQCCNLCSSTRGCVVATWTLRDAIGYCSLKNAKGPKTTLAGVRAVSPGGGSVSPPTPAPTSTPAPPVGKCSVIQNDVDFGGNDIASTNRLNYLDCCADCDSLFGCALFVWSPDSKTCFLKSKKSTDRGSYSPGAKAGFLQVGGAQTPLGNVQDGVYNPLPSLQPIAFHYISSGQWLDSPTMTTVLTQVDAFVSENLARNLSHDSGPIEILNLEVELALNVYVNVTSTGECATLAGAFKANLFTYVPSQFVCLVHDYSSDAALQLVSGNAATTLTVAQSLGDAFQAGSQANVASNDACVQACQAKKTCAGVVYSGTTKACTFYQPKSSRFSDAVAGWTTQGVFIVDAGRVQYAKMVNAAALPNAYRKELIPGVASVNDCAITASQKKTTLFGYSTNVCSLYEPIANPTKTLNLVNTPLVPVSLAGAFGSDVVSSVVAATSASECYKLCLPSQNNCFGSIFDTVTKTCGLYQAGFDASSTLGWVIPKTLPDTMAKTERVDLYVTAHEDDHELFMAVPVYNSIKNPTTKAVFVYMSAGDAGQTNGWWEAREVGTVAATKTWVNLFGQYAPTIRTETVLLQGHHIQKVSVGNAVHYFIRLTEDGYRAVLASQRRAPID